MEKPTENWSAPPRPWREPGDLRVEVEHFLAGADLSWAAARCSDLPVRPTVDFLIDRCVQVSRSAVTVLNSPAADGKTAVLRQLTSRLDVRGAKVLWGTGGSLDIPYLTRTLPKVSDRVVLVVDDVQDVLVELAELIEFISDSEIHHVAFVGACRDIDLRHSFGRQRLEVLFDKYSSALDAQLQSLNFGEDDARCVLSTWKWAASVPPHMDGSPEPDLVDQMVRAATRRQKGSGFGATPSLLGALLELRSGSADRLGRRIFELVDEVSKREGGLGGVLGLLAVADHCGFDGVELELLLGAAKVLDPGSSLSSAKLADLSTEVVSARGRVFGTRHEAVASLLAENLFEACGFDLLTVADALLVAANELSASAEGARGRVKAVRHLAPRLARLCHGTMRSERETATDLARRQATRHAGRLAFVADEVLAKIYVGRAKEAIDQAETALFEVGDHEDWRFAVRPLLQHWSLALGQEGATEASIWMSIFAVSDQASTELTDVDLVENLFALRHRLDGTESTLADEVIRACSAIRRERSTISASNRSLELTTIYQRTPQLTEQLAAVAAQAESVELLVASEHEDKVDPDARLTFRRLGERLKRAAQLVGPRGRFGVVGDTMPDDVHRSGLDFFRASLRAELDEEAAVDEETAALFDLFEHQQHAVEALAAGKNVVLATPTGSGKTVVAKWAHLRAAARGRRAYYTAPTRALVNEKFIEWRSFFGTERVGLATGDESIQPNARLLCCTAEVVAELAMSSQGFHDRKSVVVVDEAHYYGDPERGLAWQLPMMLGDAAQFLLMSATLGDADFLADRLAERTGREAEVVRSAPPKMAVEYQWDEHDIAEVTRRYSGPEFKPTYVVAFQRSEALRIARRRAEGRRKSAIEFPRPAVIQGFVPVSPFGQELAALLEQRIAVHHGGMLPTYRRLVERAVNEGDIDTVIGTDTLGVGVNMPITTVIFSQLWKNAGEADGGRRLLRVGEFRQIAGRAGRVGRADRGLVVGVAPPQPVRRGRGRRRDARPRADRAGLAVPFDEQDFERLRTSSVETLEPAFNYSSGLLLHALARRAGDSDHGILPLTFEGVRSVLTLLKRSHVPAGERSRIAERVRADIRRVRQLNEAMDGFEDVTGLLRHGRAFGITARNEAALLLAASLGLLRLEQPSPEELLALVEAVDGEKRTLVQQLRRHRDRWREGTGGLPPGVIDELLAEPDVVRRAKAAIAGGPLEELGFVDVTNFEGSSLAPALLAGRVTLDDLSRSGMSNGEDELRGFLTELARWLGKRTPPSLHSRGVIDLRSDLLAVADRYGGSLLDDAEAWV